MSFFCLIALLYIYCDAKAFKEIILFYCVQFNPFLQVLLVNSIHKTERGFGISLCTVIYELIKVNIIKDHLERMTRQDICYYSKKQLDKVTISRYSKHKRRHFISRGMHR